MNLEKLVLHSWKSSFPISSNKETPWREKWQGLGAITKRPAMTVGFPSSRNFHLSTTAIKRRNDEELPGTSASQRDRRTNANSSPWAPDHSRNQLKTKTSLRTNIVQTHGQNTQCTIPVPAPQRCPTCHGAAFLTPPGKCWKCSKDTWISRVICQAICLPWSSTI